MAFVVQWVKDGRPDNFGDELTFDTTGGVLRIGLGDGEWTWHFAPNAWYSVHTGPMTEQDAAKQAQWDSPKPSFGRMASEPGWREARDMGYPQP